MDLFPQTMRIRGFVKALGCLALLAVGVLPLASGAEISQPSMTLIPKREVGADAFLRSLPKADGRGVIIAVIDTGVDPAAAGLQLTSTGERKIVDVIDATGSGDVDMSRKVKPDGEGRIRSLGGSWLRLPDVIVNPSGEFRVGLKAADDILPASVVTRLREHLDARQRARTALARETSQRLPSEALERARAKAPVDRTRAEQDLIARFDGLRALEDRLVGSDADPILFDCVLWHDGEHWRAVIDTDRDGDLRNETVLRPFGIAGEHATLDPVTNATFAIQVYAEGDVLSVVTVSGTHGTHVAAIAASHFPGQPERDGIAPGARILSIRIGDPRTSGSSNGTAEQRALASAARYGARILNASWGGSSSLQDGRNAISRAYDALVERFDVLAVVSAGNGGPALSTGGSPGGESGRVLGVGAYLSPAMARYLYQMSEEHPEVDAAFAFSSRDPTKDGFFGVDVMAPGAAWAAYSLESLRSAEMLNGTSMAAPSAAGVAALVLSAAQQSGMEVTAPCLRAALRLGASAIPEEDVFARGAGLVNAPAAWERLQAIHGHAAFDAFYDVSVGGGTFTDSGRGLLVREPQPRAVILTTAQIRPAWTERTGNDVRSRFEAEFELRSTADWVEAPGFVSMANGSRGLPLKVTPPVAPGVHVARVEGFLKDHPELGPVFSVPVTVIRSEPDSIFRELRSRLRVELDPARTERRFFAAPRDATKLRLRITHASGDALPRRFGIHAVSLSPEARIGEGSERAWISLEPGETRVIDVPAIPGAVAEVAFHQMFSSRGRAVLDVELEWIGLGLGQIGPVFEPNLGWSMLPLSPLGNRTVKVDAKLEHAVRTHLPVRTRRGVLDERAEYPASPMLAEPLRASRLVQTFELEFRSATRAAILPPHEHDSLELVVGGLVVAMHESGQLVFRGAPNRTRMIQFPKGKTTVTREFSVIPGDESHLDSVEYTPIRLATVVPQTPAIPIRAGLRGRFGGLDLTTISLTHGRETVLYLRDQPADDLAEIEPRPSFFTGRIAFRDEEDRLLAEVPIMHVPGASVRKEVNQPARPQTGQDRREPVEQLADSLYETRLAFVRNQRSRTDPATRARREALLADLIAERPHDPAPKLEAAIDAALKAGLASRFWGTMGEAAKDEGKDEAEKAGEEKSAESEPPAPAQDADALAGILALLDEALQAADPDAVAKFLGAPPATPTGDPAARHRAERERKRQDELRSLIARVHRLRSDVLRASGKLEEAWTSFAEVSRWEDSPHAQTRQLEVELHRASGHLGLALEVLNRRIGEDPFNMPMLRERVELYRSLGWSAFADREELALQRREAARRQISRTR